MAVMGMLFVKHSCESTKFESRSQSHSFCMYISHVTRVRFAFSLKTNKTFLHNPTQ